MQFFKDTKVLQKKEHRWWHFIFMREVSHDKKWDQDSINGRSFATLKFCTKCGYEKKLIRAFMSDLR